MSGPLDARLAAGFAAAFGGVPDGVVRAPGRVNLIGEHTDYNDGFVLPCALPVETRVAWRARPDRRVNVVACDFGGDVDAFDLDEAITRVEAGGWRNYVRGTVAVLEEAGYRLGGADLALAGNIPRGAGLSSSASLEVAVGLAMLTAAGRDIDPIRLAGLAQRAENSFVGVNCGIMDQLAAAASVAGAALLIDCRSLATRPVAIPEGAAIAIVHSGVERGLTAGHYNERRAQCEAAAHGLGVAALRDATLADLARHRRDLDPEVHARAHHVVTENARVLEMAEALEAGDLPAMAGLMAASHASMRDDFAISVPAVDRLVATARQAIDVLANGAGGVRMTGGGFGGAVVVVTRRDAIDAVVAETRRAYRTPQGTAPDALIVRRAAAGASHL